MYSDDYLLSGTESGTVSVRIMGSGKLIHSLQSVDITPVNSIAASSNGKVMISYGHRYVCMCMHVCVCVVYIIT